MTETSTPLTRGGRNTIRVVIVAAAIVLCLGVVTSLTTVALGVGRIRAIADTQTLPATLRTLHIDAANVPMAIRVVSDDEATEARVELRFVTTTGTNRHELDVTSDAESARVSVRGAAPGWLRWVRAGEVKVVLPPAAARGLTLNTAQRYGALMVDADLDKLVARTDNGAVILRGAARTTEIHNEHGSIHSRRPIAVRESFSANTVEGRISVDFQDPPPPRIEATTGQGEVTIGLGGDGPFLVQASTGAADGRTVVRVPRTSDPTEAVSEVTARSEFGSVTIDDRI
ncbi:hypothetical protein [[Mycobacterium] burgundiense]|uniref:Adhesin domain-containing protein n=1 Tax=[Mycobacterium] burgundiense TaxID=3064286 RepID=A0ABN9N1C2_9MYCO|nr:hypothetical protein [Mycolicibacterium sp. MU0053]CAJ1498721.1 hypothetical protein MU0053_001229 [Mycolicibacterium sp. MU0053]